jgi:hypothetical protein
MYASHHHWRELATRQNDGLQVWLLWNQQDNLVKVAVTDTRLDQSFEINVPGADALAAFYHPFAQTRCKRARALHQGEPATLPRQS